MPWRNRNLDRASLVDQDNILYTHLRKQSPREIPRSHQYCQDSSEVDNPGRADRSPTQYIRRCSPSSRPDYPYSDLGPLDGKSLSVPLLDDSSDPEPHRLSTSPRTPPRLSPKATRQGACYDLDKIDTYSRPSSSHSLEHTGNGSVYQMVGGPGNPLTTLSGTRSEQQTDSVYAEVPESPGGWPSHASRPTCELSHEDSVKDHTNSHTYEPLEDIRLKHSHTTWGFKVSNAVMHSFKYDVSKCEST